jgi:hypothetical protein
MNYQIISKLSLFVSCLAGLLLQGCDTIFPNIRVLLNRADFEVDTKANMGRPFVCHLVIAYSQDAYNKLSAMTAASYFSGIKKLVKEYRDALEVMQYDIIPGKSIRNIKLQIRDRKNAVAAFLFARYDAPGKFMENVGIYPVLIVKFGTNNFEVLGSSIVKQLLSKNGKIRS